MMKNIIENIIPEKRNLATRVIAFLTLLLISLNCFSQTDKWQRFDKAFRDYIENPTHDNSIKAYELLPNELNGGDYPDKHTLENIYLTSNKLDHLIVAGNRDALRLGFRLFTIADGEYAEALCWTIGKLINKKPKMFLEELNNHRKYLHDVGGISCNYGPEFYDNTKQSLTETKKRIKSLKKINDNNLENVKNECLMELENFEKALKEALIEEEKRKAH